MTVNQMRAEVAKLYSSEGWRQKVEKMSDNQIIAIYHRKVLGDANKKQ